MGQSGNGKCSHCHQQLPSTAIGGGKLVYCPYCGKSLSNATRDHMKSMERIDGGFVLSLGDDPVAATPAANPTAPTPNPTGTHDATHGTKPSTTSSQSHPSSHTNSQSHTHTHVTKPKPANTSSDGHKEHQHKLHRHHEQEHRSHRDHATERSASPVKSKPPITPKPHVTPRHVEEQSPSADDTADLLSLDLDMIQAEEAKSLKPIDPPPVLEKPSKLKHVGEGGLKVPVKPAADQSRLVKSAFKASNDDNALPMLDEPVLATPRKTPTPVVSNKMDDTLAGLQDEEDQLDLAAAEEVVQLQVDQDDDGDLTSIAGIASGLIVTDAVDEEEFDTEIKPEESVPVVGLNMLQEHVGRASTWDRVPLPELAASDQSSVYELAVEPEVAAGKVCPDCNAPMPFDAVVCATCGYSIQLGRHIAGVTGDPMGDRYDGSERFTSDSEKYEQDQEYYHQQHLIQDVYIPTVVLLAMLVFLVFTVVAVCPYEMVSRDIVEAWIPSKMPVAPAAPLPGTATMNGPFGGPLIPNFGPAIQMPDLTRQQKWFCIAYLFGTNLFEIAMKIPFMFLGMLLVVRLFGVSFGGIFSAMTKILAIAMTAHVLAFFINAIMFILTEGLPLLGMDRYVSFPFAVISFIGLNMKFFELDVQEAVVLYLTSYLMPIFASMLIIMWVMAMVS